MSKLKIENPTPDQTPMTPEERLFRVIANGGDNLEEILTQLHAEKAQEASAPAAPLKQTLDRWRHALANNVSYIGDPLHRGFDQAQAVLTRPVDFFSGVLKWVGLICLVILFIYGFMMAAQRFPFRIEIRQFYPQASWTSQNLETHAPGSGAGSTRVIPGSTAVAPASSPVAAKITPLRQRFKLVGISWDKTEYIAMIEAESSKGARFVHKGDRLPGDVTVNEVKEFSVELKHGNQVWELS